MNIEEIFLDAVKYYASDIFIIAGLPLSFKINGDIRPIDAGLILSPKDTEELIKKGCRKIMILTKKRSFSASQKRFEGYKEALKKYDIPFDANLVMKFDGNLSSFDETKKIVDKAVSSGLEFDGIFATSDWRAYGALISLKEHGISVPEKVKIIGFDNISISKYSYPKITTVNQDREAIIQQVSNLLFDLMNDAELPDEIKNKKHIVIPVSLVNRETT